MSQGLGPDNKPLWAQPCYEEKWMSRLLYKKLRENIDLTDEERKNVSYLTGGVWNKDYPYITERADGKWSLERWTDFLIDLMHEQVIPDVKAAAERRGHTAPPAIVPEEDLPEEPQSQASPAVRDDDEIPF
jgi:hypothetical protein